jgi:hypothetical protein
MWKAGVCGAGLFAAIIIIAGLIVLMTIIGVIVYGIVSIHTGA